ncbi:hypothetical protein J2755_001251 [Methanohalophilus levihalophilus]|uniref:hypothetical protein n=1 Tax=Methanohalophilus levihalophilus TaxID=1431282 RepID=UPI001AE610BF|nr:hypothetical protein [Methanohalophilus levihalophilus]MBP2030317.1 hypothetical protein [Methanohalophilus levihalophilus]
MVKNITVGISDELSSRMDEFKEVNWSAITRICIEKYMNQRSSDQFEKAISEVQSKKDIEFKNGFNFLLYNIKKVSLDDLEFVANFEVTDPDEQDTLHRNLTKIANEIYPGIDEPINTSFLYGMQSSAKEVLKRA